jgi:hypothetical protein
MRMGTPCAHGTQQGDVGTKHTSLSPHCAKAEREGVLERIVDIRLWWT